MAAATPTDEYTIAAFDPGERTGFVVAEVKPCGSTEPAGWPSGCFTILDQGVLTVKEVGSRLAVLLEPVDHVVYETWRLYPDWAQKLIGNDMQPSQVVGMIRYEAWKQKKLLKGRGATIKKQSVKTMPDWLTAHMTLSSEQHDQDALMHAWYHAVHRYYYYYRGKKK